MMKYGNIFAVTLMFIYCTSCNAQTKTDLPNNTIKSESKDVITSSGPTGITRAIKQDRNGNIWMAAFDGIFRYDTLLPDGQAGFINVTSKVSTARFFSVLEDRKGNFWFGSIGSGAYHYDGISFQNFTTNDGLVNNEIGCIYEDKAGNIWFGVNGGASRYDGKSFRNYMMNGDSMSEVQTGKIFPNLQRPPNEVTSIIEDKTGKFWFGTRGNAFVYDARMAEGQGKAFTIVTHDGIPFKNVRWIIEDKKGNIWLGGPDGLWRYDGSAFTNFSKKFVGYIYEDKNGNIWTSSEGANNQWVLSRYDEKSLSNNDTAAIEIKPNEGMLFGILEANDGSIWVGTLNGVKRIEKNSYPK